MLLWVCVNLRTAHTGLLRFARASLIVLAVLSASPPADAAGVAGLVDWDAPEACPGALDVYARLSSVLGYEPETLGKLSRVRGSVVPAASGYRLVLETFESGRRSSRIFEAASCDDLADAAALAVALAMAPPSGAGAEREPGPAPIRPEVVPPKTPAVETAGAQVAASGAEAWRARGFAAASAVLEYGALPAPAPGIGLDGGVRLGAISVGAYGVLLDTQLQEVAPAQSVQFALWFAGVRGCYPLLEHTLELSACLSFEAGRFSARGVDLRRVGSSNDLWLAAGGALAARWPSTGSLALELRAEPMLPMVRKEYTVNGSDDVHAPGVSSMRVYLGLILLGG